MIAFPLALTGMHGYHKPNPWMLYSACRKYMITHREAFNSLTLIQGTYTWTTTGISSLMRVICMSSELNAFLSIFMALITKEGAPFRVVKIVCFG